jgi:transcriptional regulator with XRE-family HTH domain
MITGEQVRAARKLLGWSQIALALQAGITQGTVTNIETGKFRLSVLSVSTIQRALEAAGVEFPEGAEPKLTANPAVTGNMGPAAEEIEGGTGNDPDASAYRASAAARSEAASLVGSLAARVSRP